MSLSRSVAKFGTQTVEYHFSTKAAPVPIAVTDWPPWAKALRALSKSDDKGVGDVVARMIGEETSEKFKAWYLTTFGKPCGCNGRQAQWNRMYPLP